MTIRSEQLEFKKGKIGASQVAAALGLSPFQTPANLAMELMGRVKPQEENEAMRIGNIMEPAIAQIYMDREEMIIHPWEATEVHPTFEWLIAHPDYFYNDENEIKPICLIEIKNVGARQRFRWEDGVPVHVVAQCVLQVVEFCQAVPLPSSRGFETARCPEPPPPATLRSCPS